MYDLAVTEAIFWGQTTRECKTYTGKHIESIAVGNSASQALHSAIAL